MASQRAIMVLHKSIIARYGSQFLKSLVFDRLRSISTIVQMRRTARRTDCIFVCHTQCTWCMSFPLRPVCTPYKVQHGRLRIKQIKTVLNLPPFSAPRNADVSHLYGTFWYDAFCFWTRRTSCRTRQMYGRLCTWRAVRSPVRRICTIVEMDL